jgi:hypothetical protein
MAAIPRRGDKAFAGVTDVEMGMTFLRVIGFDRSYAEGFKGAADTLVESILCDDIHLRFQMVIPACYLYRHYLELEMKYILITAGKLKIMTLTDEDLETHELYPLWNLTRKVITTVVPAEPKVNLSAMEAIIQEFHCIDRSGQELRYHKRTDGKESLQKLEDDFSLANLRLTMAKVQIYFEGISGLLDAMFDGIVEPVAPTG